MIDALLIINESGSLIFNWHPESNNDEARDDLLSGFLTALNSFATVERGEDIKSLKLKETTIIFEKFDEYYQKLTFVVTTKNEKLIDLLHLFIHEVMDQFVNEFKDQLTQEFDGNITIFRNFNGKLKEVFIALGLDILTESVQSVNENELLKSIIFLEPKGGKIFFIHAKHYLNREKIIYLIPLLLNSARLLYNTNLNEEIRWFLLNTIQNDTLVVELRNKLLIVKQYQLNNKNEEEIISEDYINKKEKLFKKSDKIPHLFKNIELNPKIMQLFIVNFDGKIQYSKIIDDTYDYSEYIPETISFLIASRKTSEEIYNRALFNCIIGGEKFTTICMNFNQFGLVLIGNTGDFASFEDFQKVSFSVIKQL